jgi:hypothetical protein
MDAEQNLYDAYEKRKLQAVYKHQVLPCMLLTGFLGAGSECPA